MYIRKIDLKKITCFEEISLDFTHPVTDNPCPWVVLLGENGTGKSTILQMIALSLLGADMTRQIISDPDYWEKFIRVSAIRGQVEIGISTASEDKKSHQDEKKCQGIYRSIVELDRTVKSRVQHNSDVLDYKKLENTLYTETLTGGWFSSGYGVWRSIPRHKSSASLRNMLRQSSAKRYRFITLFDENASLVPVSDWLVDLEFRRLKDHDNALVQRSFDLAIQTLETVLVGLKFKAITPDGDVIFEENGTEVPIGHLSDGYRSVAAWVGDLVRRLVEAFPTLENPLDVSGVVLVDEVDIHLHPKWQRTIVDQIRKSFPKLQFIVASHSPFIAQDVRPEDKVIILQKEGDNVKSYEDTGTIKSWRVDQILTGPWFDLKTTRNIAVESAEQEYQELLNLEAIGKLTESQKERLEGLEEWLYKYRSGPGETIDENKLYDVTETLLDLLDEQLAQ